MLICYPNYRSLKIFAITPAFVKRIIVELEVRAFNADRLMTRFYFDFRDASGILRDDAGEELPSATIARKEALRIVGQAVQDLTYRHSEGCVVIDVRDGGDLSSGSRQSSKRPLLKSNAPCGRRGGLETSTIPRREDAIGGVLLLTRRTNRP
jgi:hypothetical protein